MFFRVKKFNIIGSLTQTEWEKMMLECSFALHPPDEKGKNVLASNALVDSSENIISLLFFEHTISLLYDHSYSYLHNKPPLGLFMKQNRYFSIGYRAM